MGLSMTTSISYNQARREVLVQDVEFGVGAGIDCLGFDKSLRRYTLVWLVLSRLFCYFDVIFQPNFRALLKQKMWTINGVLGLSNIHLVSVLTTNYGTYICS